MPELDVTIGRQDNVRRNSEGGGGGKAGSAAPLNLDALQLKYNLASLNIDANYYAGDQFAAGIAWTVQDWVTKAELLISGPEEEVVNHAAIRDMVEKAKGEPLPPREAIDYLRKETKLKVKMTDFKNWVRYGHLGYVLDRVATDDSGRKIYYPGEIFKTAQRMRDKRAKV